MPPVWMPSHVSFLYWGWRMVGEVTGAQGLSNARSWIQASGAMVMVAIETHWLHSTRLPGSVGVFIGWSQQRGGARWWLEPPTPGRANSHPGHPTCVSVFPSYPPSSCRVACSLRGFGCWALRLEYSFWLLHSTNSYSSIKPHPDAFFHSANIHRVSAKYTTLFWALGTKTDRGPALMELPV